MNPMTKLKKKIAKLLPQKYLNYINNSKNSFEGIFDRSQNN